MSALLQLAKRVEAATGPDRLTDAEIYVDLDAKLENLDALAINGEVGSWVPAYTASLDAAMTLVPGGWDWSTGTGRQRGWATLGLPSASPFGSSDDEVCCDDAATPALALCAASLRAHASGETE